MGLEVVVILLLVIANGVFSMSEIAVFSSRKSKLESLARRGDGAAKKVLQFSSQPTRFISTIQIGITFIGILSGVYGGANLTDNFEEWVGFFMPGSEYAHTVALVMVFLMLSLFTLVLGELVPKKLALHNPEFFARAIINPISWVSYIASPLVSILSWITELILKPFNLKKATESSVTEDEIKNLIDEGTASGEFEEVEQNIIERVFSLGDRKVGSLMTHRIDTEWLDIRDEFEINRRKILESEHHSFPLCDDSIDNVLGIIYTKRFMVTMHERLDFELISLAEKPLFIPENMTAFNMLEKFRERNTKIAVVVDEYGAVQGVVTMTDLIEALVGEIDVPVAGEELPVIEREDGTFLVDAMLSFEEFIHYFEIEDDEVADRSGFHTLGGFILHLNEQIPRTGEVFRWKDFSFEIVDMDGNRIDKILVKVDNEPLDDQD